MRRDLRSLSKENAAFVGAHLIAAGTLADEDPEPAWAHARAARSKGGRIAVVRETAGLVAYRAGEWAEAISELRAARRLGGGAGHLAVLADCERALGHPEKAIEIARSAEAALLEPDEASELTIVVAGARADLGQLDAAIASLEATGFATAPVQPYSARVYYAYADLLEQAGRRAEALDWFMKAADNDPEEDTDAGDRITALAEAVADPAPDATSSDPTGQDLGSGPQSDVIGEPDPVDALEPDAGDPPPSEPDADEVVADEVVAHEVVADEVVADEVVADEPVADDDSDRTDRHDPEHTEEPEEPEELDDSMKAHDLIRDDAAAADDLESVDAIHPADLAKPGEPVEPGEPVGAVGSADSDGTTGTHAPAGSAGAHHDSPTAAMFSDLPDGRG